MDSFLDSLNDLIASTEDISATELIGALELTKQGIILEILTDDDDEDAK